jgi:hypothetical protein
MGSTYHNLHNHWVCATKQRRPLIQPGWRQRLHQYLGGTIRGLAGVPLEAGGAGDHVHALFGRPLNRLGGEFFKSLHQRKEDLAAAVCPSILLVIPLQMDKL